MITCEKELQNELVIYLTEQGFNCKQYVPNSIGIADVVIDNAVIELKHLPDREALYKAVGQAVLYRGAIDKNLDAKIICSYYDELSFLRLQSAGVALKQAGLELIPWLPRESLIFQTDSIPTNIENTFEIGDICLVSSFCQVNLLKYNKFWAIITEKIGYLSRVQLLGEEIVLPVHHLKKLDLGQKDKEDIKFVSDRIKKLAERDDLETTVQSVIEAMQRKIYFSPIDMMMLEKAEEIYSEVDRGVVKNDTMEV